MATRKLPSEAFELYFALGPGRSYRAVADRFGSSKTAVANLATRENWKDRISERERKARAKVEEKAVETLADLNGRHLKMLRTIQAKGLEALRGMSLDRAIDAIRAIDLAIKGERLVLGEPGSDQPSAREIVQEQSARWLVHVDEEDSEENERAG